MAKGRTPNIVTLETDANKLVVSIQKHRDLVISQTAELAEKRAKIESLNSPEYQAALELLEAKKVAELERLRKISVIKIAFLEFNLTLKEAKEFVENVFKVWITRKIEKILKSENSFGNKCSIL